MRARTLRFVAVAVFSASFVVSSGVRNAFAAEGDPAVMQADRQFVQAAAKADSAAIGRMPSLRGRIRRGKRLRPRKCFARCRRMRWATRAALS
jgi:hypothetical protein